MTAEARGLAVMDVLYAFIQKSGVTSLDRAYFPEPRCCHRHFHLPDYRVTDTEVLTLGQRRISVEATTEAGCPSCGVISTRVHSRQRQRLRDIPVAGQLEVIWAKRRFFCDEYLGPQRIFAKDTAQVPRRAVQPP